MKVFKFGGASISSVEKIHNVATILSQYSDDKILIVVSAMGKTTNALEKVAEAFFAGKKEMALDLFRQIRQSHDDLAKFLLVKNALETEKKLEQIYTEAEWLLHDNPVRGFDYYYDQIVCIGELLSTTLISAFLCEEGLQCNWVDVRDIIRTDDQFRDANIDWDVTDKQVKAIIEPLFTSFPFVLTQGFIGATDENESTTLGREGSDYTAAVFANLLNAASLTIWKDVEGVMNADPKIFPQAERIEELDYAEVIEMAYYGAQVIHPKTIKPIQNKQIPLQVKCFLNPDLPGTRIHHVTAKSLPPIIVLKPAQVFLDLQTRDFSFVGEQPMSNLYSLFDRLHIRANLIQTGAVSVKICLDDHPEKIEKLALAAGGDFDVTVEKGFQLLTVRHGQKGLIEGMIGKREVRLLQQTPQTTQILIREGKIG